MFDAEDVDVGSSRSATAIGRLSAVPRPFLRWAGSKQGLLHYLRPLIPNEFGRYYEPFLGSGALFFELKPKRATLTDASAELIGTWLGVRGHVDEICDFLRPLKPDKDLFYKIRSSRSSIDSIRAAEFLYLNKTCWNGLYRVNSKGQFNVPYGAPRSDFIFDEVNLRACSKALSHSGISIRCADFSAALRTARRGDLVFLDPPYVTTHNNNGFRDWNEKLFRWDDQKRLAEIAQVLRRKGVFVIVSNANHRDVLSLYEGFAVQKVTRHSTLSSKPEFRGQTTEVVLTANLGDT